MSTILKTLKINTLSIVAFPFLLLAIFFKMIGKALEKLAILVGAFLLMGILYSLNSIINNFSDFLFGLGKFMLYFILFGSIIMMFVLIILIIGNLAAAVFSFITEKGAEVCDFFFDICHNIYSKLFDICKSDYNLLRSESTLARYTCFIFQLLRGFNWIIAKLFGYAFVIAIILCIALIGYNLYQVCLFANHNFGFGIWHYLTLFPTFNMVYAIIYSTLMYIAIIIIILSLGIEWAEWGEILQYSTQNYTEYRNVLYQQSIGMNETQINTQYAQDSGDCEEVKQSIHEFTQLMENLENLQQQVDAISCIDYSSNLVYDFTEYLQTLEIVYKELSSDNEEVNCKDFKNNFMPLIEKAKADAKTITNKINRVLIEYSSKQKSTTAISDFFAGCTSEEEVKRRYRALTKIYHPDAQGHAETFVLLQEQYEAKIKELAKSNN